MDLDQVRDQGGFQAARFEEIMRDELPMARFMDVRLTEAGPEGLSLTCAPKPNVNLHGTMFGGSIAALALLAGWGLVRMQLREVGIEPDVVVQRTLIEYVSPVYGAGEARAVMPDAEDWARFVETLERKGKGRILVEVHVSQGAESSPAALMDAWFVAST